MDTMEHEYMIIYQKSFTAKRKRIEQKLVWRIDRPGVRSIRKTSVQLLLASNTALMVHAVSQIVSYL